MRPPMSARGQSFSHKNPYALPIRKSKSEVSIFAHRSMRRLYEKTFRT